MFLIITHTKISDFIKLRRTNVRADFSAKLRVFAKTKFMFKCDRCVQVYVFSSNESPYTLHSFHRCLLMIRKSNVCPESIGCCCLFVWKQLARSAQAVERQYLCLSRQRTNIIVYFGRKTTSQLKNRFECSVSCSSA